MRSSARQLVKKVSMLASDVNCLDWHEPISIQEFVFWKEKLDLWREKLQIGPTLNPYFVMKLHGVEFLNLDIIAIFKNASQLRTLPSSAIRIQYPRNFSGRR